MKSSSFRKIAALTATATLIGAAAVTALAGPAAAAPPDGRGPTELRVATYNLSLNRNLPGQLVADLSTTTNAQAKTVAELRAAGFGLVSVADGGSVEKELDGQGRRTFTMFLAIGYAEGLEDAVPDSAEPAAG